MRRWSVTYLATASKTLTVEAETIDEAMELADKKFDHPQPCAYCSRRFDLSDWEPDESEGGVYDEGPA